MSAPSPCCRASDHYLLGADALELSVYGRDGVLYFARPLGARHRTECESADRLERIRNRLQLLSEQDRCVV